MPTKKPERDEKIASSIEQELRLILLSSRDARINELEILSVRPNQGGSHYRVFFGPPPGTPVQPGDDAKAQKQLEQAKGHLRTELAESLTLMHCPDLTFFPDPEAWLTRAGNAEPVPPSEP